MKKNLIYLCLSITILIHNNFFPLMHTVSITTGASLYTEDDMIESGTFALANTSGKFVLLEDFIYAMAIGTIWNLTVTLTENSSSGVNFTFFHTGGIPDYYWEGTSEFFITPSKTRSEQYISHFVSDDVPGFNFQYYLSNSSHSASGIYSIKKIHPGYFVNVGTGHLYVSNITRWLELRNQSSSTTSHLNPGFLVVPLILAVILYSIRKKRTNL